MIINQENTEILLVANDNFSENKRIQKYKIVGAILDSNGKIEDNIK